MPPRQESLDPIVVALRHGPFWNVTYIVGAGGEALVIDPAWNVPAILAAADNRALRITRIAVTHGHDDHVHGLGELIEATGAPAFAHALDLPLLPDHLASPLAQSDLDLPGMPVQVWHTPGHSPGSVCYVAGEHVFTGDTVNVTGPGRHGSETGAREALAASIALLQSTLPPSMLVHPGHDLGPTPHLSLGRIPPAWPRGSDALRPPLS